MNQSMKKQAFFLIISLLSALSSHTKNQIKVTNAQEALMLQTAENQAMLIEQQNIQLQQQAMLMAMFQTWQEEQAAKRAEIEQEKQQQQLIKQQASIYNQKMNALSKDMPQSWYDCDSSATPMPDYIKKRFNQTCLNAAAIAIPAAAEALLPLVAQRLFKEFIMSDNVKPFVEWLNMQPHEIQIAKLCKANGINFFELQRKMDAADNKQMLQAIENAQIELALMDDSEYVRLTEELKKLEQYDNHLIFDEDLRKRHKIILDKMMQFKESTHADITGSSAR